MKRSQSTAIYCDFDGTLSSTDIGYDLFDRFGSQDPTHEQLVSGEISIEEYWRRTVRTLEMVPTGAILDEYLASIPPRRGIADLFAVAERDDVSFTILSDGLDYYVDRWLEIFDVPDVPVICNATSIDPDGALAVSFPYGAEECNCKSAVCKRNVVVTRSAPDEPIVYIGDGLSDFCPVTYADVIFARGELAAHCTAEGLPHHSWRTLDEVARILTEKLDGGIHRRRRAENARKRAWSGG